MVITVPIEVVVPFGKPKRDTIYISGSVYTSNLRSYEITKRLNQMSSFKASLIGIDSTEKDVVAEDKDTMFFVSDLLQLKGKIKKCDYKSLDLCDISGFGEEVKLWGRSLDRSEWVSSGTDDIVAELCSENLDGGSPWVIETGTNMNWGNITIRGHFDDRLRVITNMAKATDYEWWMSTSGATYGTDVFNIGSYRGEPTSQRTFVTGSDCSMVFHERDTENLANDITVLGYGDGVNQISGTATDATSIATYGRKEYTHIDRSLTSKEVAGSLAAKYLADMKDPIERVKLTISEPYGVSGLDVGDKVTIIDNTVFPGTGSEFRIVGVQRKYSVTTGPRVYYELSNKSLSFVEEIAGTEQKVQKLGTYAKGSTVTDNLSEKENLDATENLDMRFRLPADVIRINKVLLSFKFKDFRAYTSTSAAGQSHTHDVTISAGGAHSHGLEGVTSSSENHIHFISVGSYAGATANCEIVPNQTPGLYIVGGAAGTIATTYSGSHTHTFTGETTDSQTHTHAAETTTAESTHTHAMTFGIGSDVQTGKEVVVTAGLEDAETSVGTYSTNQNELDITTNISTPYVKSGADWYNIKFNGNKNMRIEANVFLKYFVESK